MKSGYVTIIGRPNVGKSTLLNRLVGEKIAGVSPKPQTTRGVVRGILTCLSKKVSPRRDFLGQIVFVDTPGMHKPRDPLGHWMMGEIEKAAEGVDLLYWMVLPDEWGPESSLILDFVKKLTLPVFLVVNQIDRFPKPAMLPVLEKYNQAFSFRELIPISAKTGEQVELLIEKTFEHLPDGEMLFPEDQISDQNERDIAAEMIREKLFHFTSEEVPYSSTVVIESFKEREDGIVEIHATVVVEKDSQKAIVIGKAGAKMKEIGQAARFDLEKFLSKKVFLKLWAKTEEHWKRDSAMLRKLGYS